MKDIEIKELRKKVKELEIENEKLRIARVENIYGYENIYFITKNNLVSIDINKFFIEIEEGTFVDLKQVYLDNKNSIPKQKIKDKIEEFKNENYQIALDSEVAFDTGIMKNNLKIQVLEELLQESEDK